MEGGAGRNGEEREEERDGMSVHSPCKAPPSSASSLPKEQSQVELELRLFRSTGDLPSCQTKRHASPLCTLWSNGISSEKL
ncbi:hypothetical protein OIU84_019449 [Salix udensis]|uniref:Uncharacterized protein n=1 Tax=Salix udensis TaxID=889485 RepID=A0AAD6KYW8_9ROSI|nr:hypothetical protein OIU84_019449 [Salix udensis]